MRAEFVKKFVKACEENCIDIICSVGETIEVMFNGITFSFNIYEYDDKLYAEGGVTSLVLQGIEYWCDDFSVMSSETIDEGEVSEYDIEDIIHFITTCDVKKRMVKISHEVQNFLDKYNEDDLEFALEYIKINYGV